MAEILPANSNGREISATLTETKEDKALIRRITGTAADIQALTRSEWQGASSFVFTDIPGSVFERVSTVVQSNKGRGALEIRYRMKAIDDGDGLQELFGVDIVRDIYAADYFSSLTNAEIIAVREAFENREEMDGAWSQLQKRLYGHLNHGQESYTDTYYELRLSWNTTSDRNLQISADNPNTVQPLPTLKPALQNLIDGLPSGEWLKKPAHVVSAAKQGWQVQLSYIWAKEWSVIYGGTFTGEDAV